MCCIKKQLPGKCYIKNLRGTEDLQSAFDTYQSTISLLTYIERSYEMDDAKILTETKKRTGL